MTERSLEEQKQAVIEQITKAFDGVARGDGLTLHEACVVDVYGEEKEQAEARKLDTEERWQDVDDCDLNYGDAFLIYLDADGYKYYLPALMIWSLKNTIVRPEPDLYSHDFIVDTLGIGKEIPGDAFDPCIYHEVFTPEQNQAIAAYLLFVVKWYGMFDDLGRTAEEDAQLCLDNHWGQFLEDE